MKQVSMKIMILKDSPLNQIQKALIETKNNIEEAKIWLKKKGFKDAENKMSRSSNKRYFGMINNKNSNYLMVSEISCETEFVANTDFFKEFGKLIQLVIEKEKGLNESNYDKIILKDYILAGQIPGLSKVITPEMNLNEGIKTLIAKTGENCRVNQSQYIPYCNKTFCGIYLHGLSEFSNYGTTACYVYLKLKKDENITEKLKDDLVKLANCISMQIVAMNPKFIRIESIPEKTLENEREILKEKSQNSIGNKAKNINLEKIIESQLKKYFEENCLLEQEFAISSYELHENGLKVKELLKKASSEFLSDKENEIIVDKFEILKQNQ